MSKTYIRRQNGAAVIVAAFMATFMTACHAEPQAASVADGGAASAVGDESWKALPDLVFRGTISGEPLDFNDKKGEDSAAVKQFKKTGKNPYNDNVDVVKNGYTIFSTACSGCHGHLAEGKLGPALHDDYWTYPGNALDKGLFETIYGGAQGMMGPQRGHLTQDEILQVMSWIRSVYSGPPEKAKWKKK